MALDSSNELQRIYNVYLRPRYSELIYWKRILIPGLSVVVFDIIRIEGLLPKLNVVFEFLPYYIQNMSYDRYSGIYRRRLQHILPGLGLDMVDVI